MDNELKWGDEYYLAQCTSRAPETQAAKVAMMRWLKKKYHKVEALNSVWGTSFASWDSFMKNRKAVDAKKSAPDMREFNRQIMHKYFGKQDPQAAVDAMADQINAAIKDYNDLNQ